MTRNEARALIESYMRNYREVIDASWPLLEVCRQHVSRLVPVLDEELEKVREDGIRGGNGVPSDLRWLEPWRVATLRIHETECRRSRNSFNLQHPNQPFRRVRRSDTKQSERGRHDSH